MDRLPALTGRIGPIFHVHLGHGREHVANRAGILDCRLRVGYCLTGPGPSEFVRPSPTCGLPPRSATRLSA